jgi:hypothetical protein
MFPPFPITDYTNSTGKFDASPILATLERAYVIAVVLMTRETYSIVIFQRDNLVKSKTGTWYIQNEYREEREAKRDLPTELKNKREIF